MALSRDDQVLWDAIADEAERVIEERARNRDEMRERYADILGKNNYSNRDFDGLIDSIFGAFDNIEREYARKDDRLDDFLPLAVEDIVDGHFANSVLSNRRTADDLDDDTFRDMQDAVDKYKDLLGGRGRSSRYSRDDRDRGGRGDRDSRRERGGSGYSRSGGGRDRERASSRDLGRERSGSSGGSWRNRTKGSARAASGDGWGALAGEVAEVNEAEARREEAARRPAASVVAASEVRSAPVAPARPALDGPDYTKARPHDSFWENGEHWVVASKSDWKIPFDFSNPLNSVPKLYDIRTHVKYLVKNADGVVREEIVKVTDDNRYLMHEGLAQPERYHSTGRRSTPAVSLGGTKVVEEDQLNEVADKPKVTVLRDALAALPVDQFAVAEAGAPLGETLTGLVFNTRVKMATATPPDAQRLNICYRYTPIVVSSWAQEDLVKRVFESNNLAAAANQMRELKTQFDIQLWEALNKRFSDLVLRAVRFQFQHNAVKALSFANDWEKLVSHLEATKGEGFASDFAQRTAYIIQLACAIAQRADLGAFTELPEGSEVACVVFMDLSAIIALDGTLDSLGIGNVITSMETGASITGAADQALATAVRHIYGRLDSEVASCAGGCRVYINTLDGATLEVIPFAAKKENFILTAVK